jgi:hypothetical protein
MGYIIVYYRETRCTLPFSKLVGSSTPVRFVRVHDSTRAVRRQPSSTRSPLTPGRFPKPALAAGG